MTFPTGTKYAGIPLNRIPTYYLTWASQHWNDQTLREAAQTEMDRRAANPLPAPRQKSGVKLGGLFRGVKDAPQGDGANAPGQSGRGHVVDPDFTAEHQLRGMTEKEREEFFKPSDF